MNHAANIAGVDSDSPKKVTRNRWPAELFLGFKKTDQGTKLTDKRHRGPLYIQKAFYPEGRDLAHIYLLHPPAGLVSGDNLGISVKLTEGAKALLTTPGAAKLYRAREDQFPQIQTVDIQLDKETSLEWLPQETLVFPGANGRLRLSVEVDRHATFIGWEVLCYGLPAADAAFDTGFLQQHFMVKCEGVPLIIDQQKLDARETDYAQSTAGLAGKACSGLMIAGCFQQPPEELLEKLNALCEQEQMAACSYTRGFISIRYLGEYAEHARNLFVACWKLIRPELLHRDVSQPAIWHC